MSNLHTSLRKAFGALLLASCSLSAGAAVFITENFDYSASGPLYGQGAAIDPAGLGWIRYGANTASPVALTNTPLSLAGYQTTAVGKAVSLSSENLGEDLQLAFSKEPVLSGAIYAAMLVNVSDATAASAYFAAFTGKTSKGWVDGVNATEYGRIFVMAGDTEGTFKFGVSKNNASPSAVSADLPCGTTHLVVLKYEFQEGTTNDLTSLWVNPTASATEPATTLVGIASQGDASTTNGLQGIELRQGTTATKTAAALTVDALRVTDTWASLFEATEGDGETTGGDEDEDQPAASGSIRLSTPTLSLAGFRGVIPAATVSLTATGLKGDVTVSGGKNVVVKPQTVTAEQAAAGVELTVSLPDGAELGEYTETLTVSAEGAEPQSLSVSVAAYAADKDLISLLAFYADGTDTEDYTIYRMTGKAIVTHIDGNRAYIEQSLNKAGAVLDLSEIKSFGECQNLSVGDELQNIHVYLTKSMGNVTAHPAASYFAKVINTGKTVAPVALTLDEWKENLEYYPYALISVSGVDFGTAAGGTFSTASVEVTDGSGEAARVKPFAGDLVGSTIPQTADIVGISLSQTGLTLAPRALTDLTNTTEKAAEPDSVDVNLELLFTGAGTAIGDTVGHFAQLSVKAHALAEPLTLTLTGAGAKHFALSTSEIPAGAGETQVFLSFQPTAAGVQKANIIIESASNNALNQMFSVSAVAYDAANPPTIQADAAALVPFTAKAGEVQTQQFTVTTANLLNWEGKVSLVEQSPEAAFTLSSTSLLKSGTQTYTLSFKPKATGSYSAVVEATSLLADTVRFVISGVCEEPQEEPAVEGDEMKLSTAQPHALYTTDFSSDLRNAPLALDGWTNVAVEGTRAWWGYSFDGNGCAKVTPYDSKAEATTPCQMLLVSPPLDAANSATKLVTFRLRGDYLVEGQSDKLEVVYIDMLDGEPYMETIPMDVPAIADDNGVWKDYVLDFTDVPTADVFFIGFRFTSQRGTENAATYYVDDFSWGRTDVSLMKSAIDTAPHMAAVGETLQLEGLTVSGENLKGDISVSLSGADKGLFTLSTPTLPAQGGTVGLSFTADAPGQYGVMLVFSAEGAPVLEVPVFVIVAEPTGINGAAGQRGSLAGFDLQGRRQQAPTRGIILQDGKKILR